MRMGMRPMHRLPVEGAEAKMELVPFFFYKKVFLCWGCAAGWVVIWSDATDADGYAADAGSIES